MLRTNTCGELTIKDVNKIITLCGWVQIIRDMGHFVWIDLRDRYGITQLAMEEGKTSPELLKFARNLGREYVIQCTGRVTERFSKNPKMFTGDIEIEVKSIKILNESKLPPFTIENDTDGGEELRMKYRYLDLRRENIKNNLLLRNEVANKVRNYLNNQGFVEIETPFLIKSTPEGARDYVVPSRINQGEFYALPQSPQTFKQLLMVAGFDKYYQIVRCFRDEDLRADRQPEFTQIDCEMSFVEQDDVLNAFEGLIKHIFKTVKNTEVSEIKRICYSDAISKYGTDKPDLRFDIQISEITDKCKHKNLKIFDDAEYVGGICVPGGADFTRKQTDALTDYVRRPQIGASGMIWTKWNADNTFKSSADKFFNEEDLSKWFECFDSKQGDMLLLLAGERSQTLKALGELRLHIGSMLNLRDSNKFEVCWVTDFPLLEWDEKEKRFFAMHHPFTSPKQEDIEKLKSTPGEVRANAYDLVINGIEIGGGSVRIHNKALQKKMFEILGFSTEEAENQFGFLMNAFEYGAPPHAGIAFGFDRLVAVIGGKETIRDFIAFPKNNQGRDVMIDAPSKISENQLYELGIKLINSRKQNNSDR